MEKLFISWEEVEDKLKEIDFPENTIYGIPKGGMIAAGFLRYAKNTFDINKATVILDDIIDSGNTKLLYEKHNLPFFFLVNKLNNPELKNKWVVFPWEVDHPMKEDNIQQNIIRILQYIGEDINRDGLVETPCRVEKMYKEIFRGYDPLQRPKISIFKNGSDGLVYDEMIIDTGQFYSHCEHHMVPFFGTYWFGYIPDREGNIIGLSKVARLVDYHAAKLQIQERLVNDVVEDIWKELSKNTVRPIGMGLVVKGEHLCKSMRGVKKQGQMTTIKLKGAFLDNQAVKNEFLNFIK